MAEDAFPFFRATFYRWIQLFNEVCEDLLSVPQVLGIGDLHVENFGTWRDPEGRLIWGVNDFDEVHNLPYVNDLIRLAASAHLAVEENHLKLDKEGVCAALLQGYSDSINAGGRPFVLGEEHRWLHDTATFRLKEPIKFWDKLNAFEEIKKTDPESEPLRFLLKNIPGYEKKYKAFQRIAGLGSLGKQRMVILVQWNGGLIAREAKACVPSAYVFANNESNDDILIEELVDNCVRCKDPFFFVKKKWIIRRIAPDCSRIELESLPKEHDEQKLLHAMGWETANIHLGTANAAKKISKDLSKREKNWLNESAGKMLDAVKNDFDEWKKNN